MSASLIDGKLVASTLKENTQKQVNDFTTNYHYQPTLSVILIGDDPASTIYVNLKRKACNEVGIQSQVYELPTTITQADLLCLIDKLNQDQRVHGILVQLPLPKHINTQCVLESIHPQKDVDGFHPYNLGRLAQGSPALRPCTPYGIIYLLKYYNLLTPGQHAVIIGKSNTVGLPMALEFLLAQSTVTVCHSKTHTLKKHVADAQLLVIATGVKDVIQPTWLHSEQIVVDVGIHRDSQGKIRGDLDFDSAKNKVAWITPVPGGVGPMTIATLLRNTLEAACLQVAAPSL